MTLISGKRYNSTTLEDDIIDLSVDSDGKLLVSSDSSGSAASTTTSIYFYTVVNEFTDATAGIIPIDATLQNTQIIELATGATTADIWRYSGTVLASAPSSFNLSALTAPQKVTGTDGDELALDSSIQDVITAINSQTGTTVALDPSGSVANSPSGVTGTLVDIKRESDTGTVIGYTLFGTNTAYTPVGTLQPFVVSYGSSLTSSFDIGDKTDAVATSDAGTFSLISLFKRQLGKLTTLLSVLPTSLGQKTKTTSLAVALASDQNNALETGGNLAAINTGIQTLTGLSIPAWTTATPTFTATTDIWVFKLATATVWTVTITYTDSTKAIISSIAQG